MPVARNSGKAACENPDSLAGHPMWGGSMRTATDLGDRNEISWEGGGGESFIQAEEARSTDGRVAPTSANSHHSFPGPVSE